MKALVLSGGGARGAYQMGVWKALRRLNKKFDIVTGTSIGALNGMMYAQKNYYKCLNIWKKVDFKELFNDFELKEEKEVFKKYVGKALKGGIDTTKVQKIIYDNYKPNRLYNSKINFGVVAYNLTNKKVVYATKENTNPKKLKEYILASATCFPVFKPTKIGKNTFIDGAYYDNMPINLAVELGAEEILAVDLDSIGIMRKLKYKNVSVECIRPTSKLEPLLMFEPKAIRRMINLGYNDAMKFYNKLEGKTYTFKKDTINKLFNLYKDEIINVSNQYNINIKKFDTLEQMTILLEDALKIFKIPIENIYSYKEIVNILNKSMNDVEDIKVANPRDILKIFDKKAIVKYIYTKMNNNDKINYNIFNLLYKELNTAILLQAIKR